MQFVFTKRFYFTLTLIIVLFVTGYFIPMIYTVAKAVTLLFVALYLFDLLLLFFTGGGIRSERDCADRFSNGDENEVALTLISSYKYTVNLEILDEIPAQLQIRDLSFQLRMHPAEEKKLTYVLRPVRRGEYEFGNIIALVGTSVGFIRRRFVRSARRVVRVYPSFLRLHQYELMAISQQLWVQGQKRIRRIGNSREFDHIKEYVVGDDPRHINWSATARRDALMINHFMDERSQDIYSVIDKGRPMKMPFAGMTLLDYAINASLVISDVALRKGDRAGLLTFEDRPQFFLKATQRHTQLHQLMEGLYNQETSFGEPDFDGLNAFIAKNIRQRSLLLLYTNFESIQSLERQLPYLQMINRRHLLLVIYFRNTELDALIHQEARTTREIYDQAVAMEMMDTKALIRETLQRAGILSLFSAPENLNVNVINKYLELKTRRIL